MTYIELYTKARNVFDPERTGGVKGFPVMALYTVGRLADFHGWEQQVDIDALCKWLDLNHSNRESTRIILDLLYQDSPALV